MPAHMTEAELAAQASAAAEAQAAHIQAVVLAERDRVFAIYTLTPRGFEAARDEALKNGLSAEAFAAQIVSARSAAFRVTNAVSGILKAGA